MSLLIFLLAAACGALFSAALPPVGYWFLALALLPLFMLVARSKHAGQAFGIGFWFGLTFFALHLFWLPNSLENFFGWVAWLIYPPLVAIEGVFMGLVTLTARLLGGRQRGTLWLLPAFWLMMEWARTQGPLAFPWGSIGYLWLDTPLAQLADLSGSYGLTLLTLVLVALLSAPLVRGGSEYGRRPSYQAGITAIVLAGFLSLGALVYGFYRLQQAPPVPDRQALLVQGNTDPLGRALGESPDFELYLALSASALEDVSGNPLVIWPEGAVLGEALEFRRGESNRLRIQEALGESPLITGASVWDTTATGLQGFNTVYAVAEASITGRYDKVYLVPFGEGIPLVRQLEPLYATIYGWFGLYPYTRTPGLTINPIGVPGLVAAYICYESVFPQVARLMVRDGAEVLVNISNDAWFGSGNGAEQHFMMGKMRAIETRRYLLRAGNDGITAVIDPLGRVTQRIPRFEATSLLANYAVMDTVTPYVRFGDWLIVVVAIYSLIAVVSLRMQD